MATDRIGESRTTRRAAPWLVAASFAINLAAVAWVGLKTDGDSGRYLDGADRLIHGRPLRDKQASYTGYIAVVAACQVVGAGLSGVVAVHLAAAALAAVAQYDLGRRLGGPRAGVVAAALIIFNPDLARWHAYVLTDSLYTSMVVLATWTIHRAVELGGAHRYTAATVVVLSAALVRPNGWVLVPVAVVSWACRDRERRGRAAITAAAVGAFAIGAWVVPAFRGGIQAEHPDVMLYRGQVVWGYPPSRIAMPAAGSAGRGGWPGAVGYVGRHPAACLRLAALRVFTELAHVRPFYSRRHNVALLAFLPPLYGAALIGLVWARRDPLARLLAIIVAAHFLTVALTFADWDGRFLLYVVPAISALAACAAVGALRGGPSQAD